MHDPDHDRPDEDWDQWYRRTRRQGVPQGRWWRWAILALFVAAMLALALGGNDTLFGTR